MSYALVPPPIDNSVFAYMVDDNELEEKLEKINLYVREKAFDAYNASEVWKEMNIDYFPNDIRTYSLTVNSADKSMGATSPNGEYDEEEEVVISALPKAGYQFDHWNDGSKDNPRTIKVTGNLTYTAYFAPATPKYKYTLAVSASNPLEGAAIGGGVFESGAQATLAAVANTGYHFTQWADDNTDNPRIVTVVADATYIANFAQDPVAPTLYELNIAPENAAQGWTTEGCAYESGAQVMIYAHPAEGYQFEQWSDSNKDNPRFLTMTEEVNLTAKFVEKTTTGVSAANSSDTSAQKIVRDGQVYVLRGDKLYTLQGQEVK